jgi:hypothetical protein
LAASRASVRNLLAAVAATAVAGVTVGWLAVGIGAAVLFAAVATPSP